jgi:hypothetical protein
MMAWPPADAGKGGENSTHRGSLWWRDEKKERKKKSLAARDQIRALELTNSDAIRAVEARGQSPARTLRE